MRFVGYFKIISIFFMNTRLSCKATDMAVDDVNVHTFSKP